MRQRAVEEEPPCGGLGRGGARVGGGLAHAGAGSDVPGCAEKERTNVGRVSALLLKTASPPGSSRRSGRRSSWGRRCSRLRRSK